MPGVFFQCMASHVAAQMVHNISPTADFPEIAEFPFPLPKKLHFGGPKSRFVWRRYNYYQPLCIEFCPIFFKEIVPPPPRKKQTNNISQHSTFKKAQGGLKMSYTFKHWSKRYVPTWYPYFAFVCIPRQKCGTMPATCWGTQRLQ